MRLICRFVCVRAAPTLPRRCVRSLRGVQCSRPTFHLATPLFPPQYYSGTGPIKGRNVTKIIDSVVDALLANSTRRFSYVEQAFFQLFYESQPAPRQAQIQGLVKSRQLTFLNGG